MDEQTLPRVVVVKDDDKIAALQQVLEETDFFELLDRRHSESGNN